MREQPLYEVLVAGRVGRLGEEEREEEEEEEEEEEREGVVTIEQ